LLTKDKFQREVESLMERIKILEQDLETTTTESEELVKLQQENENLKANLDQVQSVVTTLTSQNEQLDWNNQSHPDEVSYLRKECDELKVQLTDALESVSPLNQTVLKLQNQLSSATDTHLKEIEGLKEQVEKLTSENLILAQSSLDPWPTEDNNHDYLKAEIQRLEAIVQSRSAVDETDSSILLDTLKNLTDQNAALKSQLIESEQLMTKLQTDFDHQAGEIKIKNEHSADIDNLNAKHAEELAVLRNQVTGCNQKDQEDEVAGLVEIINNNRIKFEEYIQTSEKVLRNQVTGCNQKDQEDEVAGLVEIINNNRIKFEEYIQTSEKVLRNQVTGCNQKDQEDEVAGLVEIINNNRIKFEEYIQTSEKDCEEMLANIGELKAQLAERQIKSQSEGNQNYAAQIEELEAIIEKYKEMETVTVMDLQTQVASLQSSADVERLNNDNYKKRIVELEATISQNAEDFQKSVEEKLSEINRLNAELKTAQDQLVALPAARLQETAAAPTDKAEDLEYILEVETVISNNKEKFEQFIFDTETERIKLQNELAALQEQLNTHKASSQDDSAYIEELQAVIRTNTEKFETFVNETEMEKAAMLYELNTVRNQLLELQATVNDNQPACDASYVMELETIITNNKVKFEEFLQESETERINMKAELDLLQQQVGTNAVVDNGVADVSAMQLQINDLQSLLEAKEEELSHNVEQKNSEKLSLQGEIEQLQGKLSDVVKLSANMISEEQLRSQLQLLELEIDSSRQEEVITLEVLSVKIRIVSILCK
jgi:chromosome segregation ATPase/ribosomal protein S17E